MKIVPLIIVTALLAACNQAPPPQQMSQMCGINPQTMQQSCVMVPTSQLGQQQANGQYRDNAGNAVAAGVIGAGAGYVVGQAARNIQMQEVQSRQQQNAGNNYSLPQPVTSPIQQSAFIAQAAQTKVTTTAPTGGTMKGQSEIQLTGKTVAPSTPSVVPPTPAFVPASVKPSVVQPKPAFVPVSVKPVSPPATVNLTKPASAPVRQSFTPTSARTASSSSSKFKPSSVKK